MTSMRRELGDGPASLVAVDAALSTAVITPIVVTYWRITWKLMDIYILPGHQVWSTIASVGIGFIGLFIFTLFQHRFKGYLKPRKHTVIYYVMSRSYTAAFAYSCVNSWRGIWNIMDEVTGTRPPVIAASVVIGICSLASMKTLRNIIAPPIAILTDNYDGYFEVPTLFRIGVRDGTGSWLYVLDSFFSVCIIGSLVVIVWRGVWSLMDNYLYPDDYNTSAILSLVIGYSVVLLAFALQPAIKKLVNKVNGFKRILFVDVYLLFSFFGAVNVWRGVWAMLDIHFIPDAPITSYWVSHIACFGFLVLLNSSNSILVRGVYIDAEEDGTQCVDFPCYYVRLLVQKRKRKRQIREDEEGKEMTQIKIGNEEKTEGVNEKMLLTSENVDKTMLNEVEETLNNSSKVV
ncbi:uncharacterized protein LOC132940260 isoform X2 [Metopolophium dirhodum]|uniref:uncharacterized protein LOC132940260 isoform X2 n=1 Tax=Metopolophium dirhodum TaxID=44670 RepID=UPI0029906FFD|nr:uncharacterized protein LOC132940260 isoform X2 [Metopolophium dirhodum]